MILTFCPAVTLTLSRDHSESKRLVSVICPQLFHRI